MKSPAGPGAPARPPPAGCAPQTKGLKISLKRLANGFISPAGLGSALKAQPLKGRPAGAGDGSQHREEAEDQGVALTLQQQMTKPQAHKPRQVPANDGGKAGDNEDEDDNDGVDDDERAEEVYNEEDEEKQKNKGSTALTRRADPGGIVINTAAQGPPGGGNNSRKGPKLLAVYRGNTYAGQVIMTRTATMRFYGYDKQIKICANLEAEKLEAVKKGEHKAMDRASAQAVLTEAGTDIDLDQRVFSELKRLAAHNKEDFPYSSAEELVAAADAAKAVQGTKRKAEGGGAGDKTPAMKRTARAPRAIKDAGKDDEEDGEEEEEEEDGGQRGAPRKPAGRAARTRGDVTKGAAKRRRRQEAAAPAAPAAPPAPHAEAPPPQVVPAAAAAPPHAPAPAAGPAPALAPGAAGALQAVAAAAGALQPALGQAGVQAMVQQALGAGPGFANPTLVVNVTIAPTCAVRTQLADMLGEMNNPSTDPAKRELLKTNYKFAVKPWVRSNEGW